MKSKMNKMLVFFKKKLLLKDLNKNQSIKCLLTTLLTLLSIYSCFILDRSAARFLIALRLFVELAICLKCVKQPKLYQDYVHGWAFTSFIVILFTFEFAVVTKLKILFIENTIVMLMVSCAIIFLMLSADQIDASGANTGHSGKLAEEPILIDYLYNNTLKPTNVKKVNLSKLNFVLSLAFTSVSLAYTSNLILTSVCYSKYFHKLILLPHDCSYVYVDKHNDVYQIGLYALELSFVTFVVFVRRLSKLNFEQLKLVLIKFWSASQSD